MERTLNLLNTLTQMSEDYKRIAELTSGKRHNEADVRSRKYMEAVGHLRRAYLAHGPITGTTRKDVEFRSVNGETTKKKITGVGDAILKKIQAFLDSGNIEQANVVHQERLDLEDGMTDRKKSEELLQSIYGIDKATAPKIWKKLHSRYNRDLFSIDDLRENTDLFPNSSSVKFLKHYESVRERIPRDAIFIFEIVLKYFIRTRFGSESKIVIAGSYRRGKETSGDVDVLVGDANYSLKELVDFLVQKRVIVEVLSLGDKKAHCIAGCPGNFLHPFRMDIQYSNDPASWASMLLYFSSGVHINRWMRLEAANKGYKLSEYGLTKGSKMIPTPSEERIFEILEIPYIPVSHRD